MAHHAYFVTGERDAGVSQARQFVEQTLGLTGSSNPDIVSLSFGLFSVEDARRLISTANLSASGGTKAIIASMTRIFHEAQNSLLKILEEPPEGVTIILSVPSEGVFIPTLRSRLLSLPSQSTQENDPIQGIASQFLAASQAEREKIASQLVDRSKSDKEEVKQKARQEAIDLINGITVAGQSRLESVKGESERNDLIELLEELTSFTPILYERSAPLKLMLEHVLLVIPKSLAQAKV